MNCGEASREMPWDRVRFRQLPGFSWSGPSPASFLPSRFPSDLRADVDVHRAWTGSSCRCPATTCTGYGGPVAAGRSRSSMTTTSQGSSPPEKICRWGVWLWGLPARLDRHRSRTLRVTFYRAAIDSSARWWCGSRFASRRGRAGRPFVGSLCSSGVTTDGVRTGYNRLVVGGRPAHHMAASCLRAHLLIGPADHVAPVVVLRYITNQNHRLWPSSVLLSRLGWLRSGESLAGGGRRPASFGWSYYAERASSVGWPWPVYHARNSGTPALSAIPPVCRCIAKSACSSTGFMRRRSRGMWGWTSPQG